MEVEGKSEEELDALLESLVNAGEALPRSRESDPYVLPARPTYLPALGTQRWEALGRHT